MGSLTSTEQDCVERAAAEPMLDQVEAWAAVNSGSRNLAGLADGGRIARRRLLPRCPGEIALVEPAPVDAVDAERPHGRDRAWPQPAPEGAARGAGAAAADRPHGHGVRRRSSVPGDQLARGRRARRARRRRHEGRHRGDARGAEGGRGQRRRAALGYEVVINSDEEVGSPGSAALIAAAARGKRAALTYEPVGAARRNARRRAPGKRQFLASPCAAARPTPAAIPRTAATPSSPPPTSRLRLEQAKQPDLAINPARIDGGGPNNVVPDLAILRVNLRPATPEDELRAQDADRGDASPRSPPSTMSAIDVHGGFGRPPKPMTPEAEALFKLVKQAGADLGQASAGRRPAAFATATTSPPAACRWSTRWACAAARSTAWRNI